MNKKQSRESKLALVLALSGLLFVAPASADENWLNKLKDFFITTEPQDHDDDEIDAEPISPMTVELDATAQQLAAIETIPLSTSHLFPEKRTRATVVNVQPMLAQQAELSQLEAALNVAKVNEQAARRELSRLQELVEQTGSVATKNVNHAEAQWRQALAHVNAARLQLENHKIAIRQKWDTTIADWILTESSPQFQRLVTREDSLLLVVMPFGQQLADDVRVIRVAAEGARDEARKAYYIAPALMADAGLQGETYYFRLATGRLRSGMRLDAWVPESETPREGMLIPDAAIVWHAGNPWAYIQIATGHYQRTDLSDGSTTAKGIFLTDGQIKAGDALVIKGAQTLLSEEFKWQIHDEDDDD